jgi:hypothetical protein
MFGQTTSQDGNTAENIAGRDINDNRTFHFSSLSSAKHKKLKDLFEKFEHEKKNNIQLNEIIDDLLHYTTPKAEIVVGLEAKLRAANRDGQIEFAKEVKEKYAKKLTKYQFFMSAQKINVYLLGLVWTYFMQAVYPMICNGESEEKINSAINSLIIEPLLEALDGDTMEFNPPEIFGMIYFLTGNCHIKWVK